MTTFTLDADFQHPNATVEPSRGGNGVHIKFPNEWVVSVQWGPMTYSSNRDRYDYPAPELDATTAEIAAWQGDTGMIEWPDGDTVQGWQSWDDVQRVLDAAENGALPLRETDAPKET